MCVAGWDKQGIQWQLRHFALRFIHLHRDATGVLHDAFREIVTLTTSGSTIR